MLHYQDYIVIYFIHCYLLHSKDELYRNKNKNKNENEKENKNKNNRFSMNINKECFIDFIYEELKNNNRNIKQNKINSFFKFIKKE